MPDYKLKLKIKQPDKDTIKALAKALENVYSASGTAASSHSVDEFANSTSSAYTNVLPLDYWGKPSQSYKYQHQYDFEEYNISEPHITFAVDIAEDAKPNSDKSLEIEWL